MSIFVEVSTKDLDNIEIKRGKGKSQFYRDCSASIGLGKTVYIKHSEYVAQYNPKDTSNTPKLALRSGAFIVEHVAWHGEDGWTIKRVSKEEKAQYEALQKAQKDAEQE